jgi:uncharacterized membrane protein YfcA
MSGADVALIAIAGLLCGTINTIAGGGSLILFPALLATGLPPLSANVTNSVATWPGYVGGVTGFRRELEDQGHRLPPLLLATLAGSTTGCILLLVTPKSTFDIIVPGLVLFASLLTGFQPWLKHRLTGGGAASGRVGRGAVVAVFFATIYGGYFGGALGVIVVAVLTLTVHDTLRRLTALKSVVSLVDASVSVVIFGIFGPVHWMAVGVAAPTTLIGGYAGAAIAKRLSESLLRWSVVVFGVGVSIYLFVR